MNACSDCGGGCSGTCGGVNVYQIPVGTGGGTGGGEAQCGCRTEPGVAIATTVDKDGQSIPAGTNVLNHYAADGTYLNSSCFAEREVIPDPECDNAFKLNFFAGPDGKKDHGFVEEYYNNQRVTALANQANVNFLPADWAPGDTFDLYPEVCNEYTNPHCRLNMRTRWEYNGGDLAFRSARGVDGWVVRLSLERAVNNGAYVRLASHTIRPAFYQDGPPFTFFEEFLDSDTDRGAAPLGTDKVCFKVTGLIEVVGTTTLTIRQQNAKVSAYGHTEKF